MAMEQEKTSLVEEMEKAHIRRKYYLNRRVAMFTTIHAKSRKIDIPQGLTDKLTQKQRNYINELVDNYGYSPQASIPCPPQLK